MGAAIADEGAAVAVRGLTAWDVRACGGGEFTRETAGVDAVTFCVEGA